MTIKPLEIATKTSPVVDKVATSKLKLGKVKVAKLKPNPNKYVQVYKWPSNESLHEAKTKLISLFGKPQPNTKGSDVFTWITTGVKVYLAPAGSSGSYQIQVLVKA